MSPSVLAAARARHADCDTDGDYRTWDEARTALALHAAHAPTCPHYLGATAYLSSKEAQ